MTNPETGETSTIDSFTIKLKGPDNIQFGWLIEHEWEAVKGDWIFEVIYKGKTVLSKKIVAY